MKLVNTILFVLFFCSDLLSQNPTIIVHNQGNLIIKDNSFVHTNDNFVVKTGGKLKMINNGSLIVENGNFFIHGNFNSGQGNVIMYQDINHDHYIQCSSDNTFYNLIITGGAFNPFDIHLLNNINVSNKLHIDLRKFNLNGFGVDLLTTGYLDAETDSHRAYDNNYGEGYVKRTATIGPNVTTNPGNLGLTIKTNGNQMGVTTIKRLHKRDTIQGSPSIYRIFDVTPQYNGNNYVGGLNVDLWFKYFQGEIGTDIAGSEESLQLYRSGNYGTTWDYKGGTNDVINKVLYYEGFNQFSMVTLSPQPTSLPVKLTSFNGYCNSDNIILNWKTTTEINSDYFEVLYSQNAIEWEVIGKINSYVNSSSPKSYQLITKNVSGYFRLKQVDNDGKSEMFNIIYVNCNNITKNVELYPNPNNGSFIINHNSNYNVDIFSANGQLVFSKQNVNDNQFNVEYLSQGVYFIKLYNNNKKLTFKFIKQ